MGLKGQLEDLPLIDMLQIVAFSKKSGYLVVASPSGRGAVVLQEGRVIFAYSWSTVEGLRELARHRSDITPELIREHIEASLRELAAAREGSFQFDLANSVSDELGGVKIQPFILPGGLDPQELLLDLAVEIDTERREAMTLLELAFQGDLLAGGPVLDEDEEPLDEGAAEVTPPHGSTPTPPRARVAPPAPALEGCQDGRELVVVLVDDESLVVEAVGRDLSARGYRVSSASAPAAGAKAVRKHAAAGRQVLVVVDLKMPTTSGRSFFGGFELIRRIKKSGLEPPLLLMVEDLSDKTRTRAKALGVRRVIRKPTLTKLDPELYRADLEEFSASVAAQLGKLVEDGSRLQAVVARARTKGPVGASADFIAEMTKKLVEPRGSSDISRLVLQVAERFLERGLLFVIKSGIARGLSGFGIAPDQKSCARLAQQLEIEITACQPLEQVVSTGSSLRVERELGSLDGPLFSRIGRGVAQERALIPLLYNGATLLVFFGDNATTGSPLPDLSELELFVAQAGMALENKLLQRKLDTVDSKVSEEIGRGAAQGSSR